ncbi:MAG: hypothetical protein IPH62_14845 [Ignavibacteriae bacterium]|nr:hypothetical protein [Ignavibacteriota bacterium]
MVTILGYNNSENEFLNKILSQKNIDFKYSLVENQITSAEKIIIPQPQNFNSAYKKMQMMNLFSFLRLIKKPILGINDGFCFMCNEILDKYKCGLGFFKLDVNSSSFGGNSENFVTGKIQVKEESQLLKTEFNNYEIKFDQNSKMKDCEFSKSTILFDEKIFTLTCENQNYFSVEMNFDLNPEIGENIISNFVKI